MPASSLAFLAPLVVAAAAQNVLEIGLQRGQAGQAGQPRPLHRRANSGSTSTYIETLVNNVTGGGYYASVSVGTPAQQQTLLVDTGSSDIWLVAYDANLCTSAILQEEYGQNCGYTFNPAQSSSYKLVDENGFSITYIDGSSSEGDYISDTFSIGGASLKTLQMGYATDTVTGVGIMGISFNASESTGEKYPNLLDQFIDQGLITSKAFSLYLNDFRSDTGSLLFGGLDTDKFIGSLAVLPILQTLSSGNSSYTTLAVALSGLSAKTSSGANGQVTTVPFSGELPAILDSGTTLSYLPSGIAADIFDAVDAYTDDMVTGYTFIDCDAGSTVSLTFTFDGKTQVTAPASQIVLDVFADAQDQIPENVPFARACLFGMQVLSMSDSSEATFALLGDTFLRSAYVVYDMTHNEIALAQANFNSSTSTIVELEGTATGIPAVTGVKSQQTTYTLQPSGSGSSGSASGSSGSATKTADSTGGTDGGAVTVTASSTATKTVAAKSAAGRSRQDPSVGAFVMAGAVCLMSLAGGALLLA